MQKLYDCGIDLGTTNSCLAIPDDDHGFEIIENQADRMQVTPSAVLINGKGRMLIGQRAYNSQKVEDLAIQFKRAMGTSKVIRFESAGVEKTPEELSAEILKALRNDAEMRLNRTIENVVITVPAAFKTLQSEATNKAGKLAGFKNIILLQEPIAAAVAYGAKPDAKDKHWMVFDYGGGTLDVAVISTEDGRLTVENSEGDNYFGGSDIDRRIYNQAVLPALKKEYAVDGLLDESTAGGRSLVRKILLDCEGCKIELSSRESSVLEIFDIDDDNGKPIEFECEVTRDELEALISETVESSIEIARKALGGAGIQASDLDKILLVGGSTFIPLVRRRLSEEFQTELDSTLNPMTVVAAGAAIYASTSVVDVEEDVKVTNDDHAVISLTYDPISSKEKVNVIGKVDNIADVNVSKIRIDGSSTNSFSGVDWTSGWVELMDETNGLFDVDVMLQVGKTNYFRVYVCDSRGGDITIENPDFVIKHRENVLKTSAPPATMSIGVQIQDPDTGNDILYHLIKKNTPLPASAKDTFKLSRDIDPDKNDCITIKIWEGENTINPEANHSAGEITVHSYAMNQKIPQGTEIDLSIEEDEDRMIHVSGYIPDYEYEIPEHTLRAEAKVDLSEDMSAIRERIQQSEDSLADMKSRGVEVSDLENSLKTLKNGYSSVFRLIDADDQAVNGYISRFNDIETNIVRKKLNSKKTRVNKAREEKVSRAEESVLDWGTDSQKAEMEKLKLAYSSAQGEDEKDYVARKMSTLGFQARTGNFTWLSEFFTMGLDTTECAYTDYAKAAYWRRQAYKVINDKDIQQLGTAVFQLMDLLPDDGTDSIAAFGADLTR